MTKQCEQYMGKHKRFVVVVFVVTGIVLCTFSFQRSNEIFVPQPVVDINILSDKIENMEEKMKSISTLVDNLYCSQKGVGKTGAFCVNRNKLYIGGNQAWDLGLCKALEHLFGHSTVMDLGAGLGHYGMCFLRKWKNIIDVGNETENRNFEKLFEQHMLDYVNEPQIIKSWEGYDGAMNIGLVSSGFIKPLDLSEKNVWLGHKADYVLSLEVGEHIPAEYMGNFLDNLVRHATKGIALSWAVPKQGGYHHVNELPNDIIIHEMAKRGLVADNDAEAYLRSSVKVYWFKNTLMFFRFKDQSQRK